MPRKSQTEKSNEASVERPATRRSSRLSASSPVVTPEQTKGHGKGSSTKATSSSSSKSVPSPRSSRSKGAGSKDLTSQARSGDGNKAGAENVLVLETETVDPEEHSKGEAISKDSGKSQKRGARQEAKKEKGSPEKEKEKEHEDEKKDVTSEENKAETSSAERSRRRQQTATPTSEKVLTPRRGGRGRGKDTTEASPSEETSKTDTASPEGAKRKRNKTDGAKEENDRENSLSKKLKTDDEAGKEEANVEKMEVDAMEAEEIQEAKEESVIIASGTTELVSDKTPGGSIIVEVCEKVDEKNEKEPVICPAPVAVADAAGDEDMRENGLPLLTETTLECIPSKETSGSETTGTKEAGAASSSDKTDDAVASNGINDPLLLRKFVWSKGNIPSPSCLAKTFSVVSYNILADFHAQRDFARPGSWISKEHLAIDYRHSLLMKEFRYLDSDIICLQEVGTKYFEDILKPALSEMGYDGLYVPRQADWGEGEATFFRRARFTLKSSQSLILSQVAEREIDESGIEADVKNSVKEAVKSYAVTLLTQLKCLESDTILSCANIHVAYDKFERQDKQCLQLACAIRELVKFSGGPDKPHFICGDFNSWPDSPPYQLLQDGHLSEKSLNTLQSINSVSQADGLMAPLVNYWSEGFQYSPAVNLRSAYFEVLEKEPLTSRFNSDGIVRNVDYIWFSSNTLEVKGILETCDSERIKDGVPNIIFPSDHLSLKALFSFK